MKEAPKCPYCQAELETVGVSSFWDLNWDKEKEIWIPSADDAENLGEPEFSCYECGRNFSLDDIEKLGIKKYQTPVCLQILKLAIEKKITQNEKSVRKIEKEIENHLKSCNYCRNFMEIVTESLSKKEK